MQNISEDCILLSPVTYFMPLTLKRGGGAVGERSLNESGLSTSPHTHLQSGHSYRSFLFSEAL